VTARPPESALAFVTALRVHKALEQFPDVLGGRVFGRDGKQRDTPLRPGWLPPTYAEGKGGDGYCDSHMEAALKAELIDVQIGESGRLRAVLRGEEEKAA